MKTHVAISITELRFWIRHLYAFLSLFIFSCVAFADDNYQKGMEALGNGQHEEAIDWLRKSAEAGYGDGQYVYGLLYPM